jgi:hypothetical protein
MTQIPLLIQEKVDYYLQEYYRKEWMIKNKQVIQEYHEKVKIYYSVNRTTNRANYSEMIWGNFSKGNRIRFLKSKASLLFYLEKVVVSSFTKDPYNKLQVAKLPLKYYYSSGLNYEEGYKN